MSAIADETALDEAPRRWEWFGELDARRWIAGGITLFTVVGCAVFVFAQFQPDLLFRNTTPTGGDMGAHVWTAAYLRDHLLSHGHLIGWSPDWYAGFPALQFYMLPPMVGIAVLSYLIPYGIAFKLVAVSGMVAMPVAAYLFGRLNRMPFPVPAFLAVAATLFVFDRSFSIYGGNAASTLAGEFSFGISLALTIVYLGLVGRGLAEGGNRALAAILLALATLCHILPFFFAVGWTVVWVVVWLLRDVYEAVGSNQPHRWRLLASANLARLRWALSVGVVGLLMTCFWLLPFWAKSPYTNDMGWERISKIADPLLWRHQLGGGGLVDYPTFAFLVALALVGLVESLALRQRVGLFLAGAAATAAAAFVWLPQGRIWNARLQPFWYLAIYFLAAVGAGLVPLLLGNRHARRVVGTVVGVTAILVQGILLLAPSLLRGISAVAPGETQAAWISRWGPYVMVGIGVAALVLAAELADLVSSRRRVIAWALVGLAVVLIALMRLHPAWRDSTHLLGWTIASMFLVGVSAVAEFVDSSGEERPRWLGPTVLYGGTLVVLAIMWLYTAMPLRALGPLGQTVSVTSGEGCTDTAPCQEYSLLGLKAIATKDDSFVDSWAAWNFAGYESPCDPAHNDPCVHGDKPYWPEYHAIVATMKQLGQTRGCGRAMWEANSDYDHYGTPMALMLLPFWTNGCIGSMEGLYFESSGTTPFHFINHSELSSSPSNPQRGLPYGPISRENFDLGVRHLQMLGVRYYIAYTDTMIGYARSNSDLVEVATSPAVCMPQHCPPDVKDPPTRFVVFEVEDRPLVEPLRNQPVVLTGVGGGYTCNNAEQRTAAGKRPCQGWLDPALDWYMDPSYWNVYLAQSGPKSWQHIPVQEWVKNHQVDTKPVEPVEVTNSHFGRQSISFDVDRVGQPVLVKMSYFPNWKAHGAEGPYRVSSNMMVVVPTSTHVELSYEKTPVDVAGWVLTFLGIALVVLMARRPALDMPAGPTSVWRAKGGAGGVGSEVSAAGAEPGVTGGSMPSGAEREAEDEREEQPQDEPHGEPEEARPLAWEGPPGATAPPEVL